jgi:Meckel syndrome type 1 protein
LRKALARIEIDMSASRRDEQANRPIPIPAHRAQRRPR